MMQEIKATELFKNKDNIKNFDIENSKSIRVDFSNVCTMDLEAVNSLLNLKKLAVLNNKPLSIINTNPQIKQMLDITGLWKCC